MPTIEVIRTYLQMLSPSELHSAVSSSEPVRIELATGCPASFYRYLYAEVGRNYHWVDRLGWTDPEITDHLNRPAVTLWVMYASGAPAGYFELERHEDGSTEIAYFGLLQEFIGRGLGGHLLTLAVQQAWSTGAGRVWLHTCTLDDPAAMPNYLKRGFKPFKQETYSTTVPSAPAEKLTTDH
jgi:GNAT superfamily N-acetyltransferase